MKKSYIEQILDSNMDADIGADVLMSATRDVMADFDKFLSHYSTLDYPLIVGLVAGRLNFMRNDMDEEDRKFAELVPNMIRRVAFEIPDSDEDDFDEEDGKE